jgi:hypothetical protein
MVWQSFALQLRFYQKRPGDVSDVLSEDEKWQRIKSGRATAATICQVSVDIGFAACWLVSLVPFH